MAEATLEKTDQLAATRAFRAIWAPDAASRLHIDLISCAEEWGRWALRRGAHTEAVEAFGHAVEAVRAVFPNQLSRRNKEIWLGAAREIPLLLGYAYAQRGQPRQAATAVEGGRGVLLAEAATGRRGVGAIDQHGDDMYRAVHAALRPDWSEIEAAAAKMPLCYLVPTEWGGFAVVAVGDRDPVVISLPTLTTAATAEQASSLRTALADVGEQKQDVADVVEGCLTWAWKEALLAVSERLAAAGADEIALIPGAQLAELPLHAATDPEGNCLLGRVAVTYAPSARSLLECAATQQIVGRLTKVLLVDEPSPVEGGPLRFSAAEVATIREIVAEAGAEPLHCRGTEATRDAVLEGFTKADAVHFSGHAVADPEVPGDSRLQVALNGSLTANELRDASIGATTVVTLSACESAVVGRALPEEAIGLPGALLQAGVAGVVATMWEVRDNPSVPYLLARFYSAWLGDGLPPHRALATAVEWVRSADRATLVKSYPRIEPQISSSPAATRFIRSRKVPADDWAAFVYVGM